jgi:predicted pyridoxine 5'-phosphate oxidase superfamily flavin-nucleotide-binding protein
MNIISATPETPGMTKEEVDMFLEKKFMLQISTLDEKGEPNIQPVWFYHDKSREKLLITTSKMAYKTNNQHIETRRGLNDSCSIQCSC